MLALLFRLPAGLLSLMFALGPPAAAGEERIERFDRDPGWEGVNNRAPIPQPIEVRQDFGFSPDTAHAGGERGEVGGFITPDGEPAYYARRIDPLSFTDPMSASGILHCTGRHFHVLLGFFNSATVNEWRNPNAIMLRLYGRGDVVHVHAEYATGKWRAGSALVTETLPNHRPHRWAIAYDPGGADGRGQISVRVGDQAAVCVLEDGHKADGAVVDRFGLLTVVKSVDTGGEIWIDDVRINNRPDDGTDWEGRNNRRTYRSAEVRPRFDFGFSPTHFAGGRAPGELGGLVFRGDCRAGAGGSPFESSRMAWYGDRLKPLTLERPLRASGRVSLHRGVSDSTVLLGFFHSRVSTAPDPSRTDLQSIGFPEHFLGVAIEGPSREGFFLYPAYRVRGDMQASAVSADPPRIYPDGTAHDWTMLYTPDRDGAPGTISVTLDTQSVDLAVDPTHREAGAAFDRFGMVTTWIDGNAQRVYFDDLTYTVRQE